MYYGQHDTARSSIALHPVRSIGYGRVRIAPIWLRGTAAGAGGGGGFTLIEVLLVLVLLVIAGSLSIPYLFGSFARSQLRNGGDVLRAALSEARLKAMESGQVQVMRCELKGRRFTLASLVDLAVAGDNAEPPTDASAGDDGSDRYETRLDLNQLPGGIVFASGDVAPSPQLIAILNMVEQPGWTSPIVFSPDGTATDATFVLTNENEHTLRVTLRGITGVVRVGEIDAEEAPDDAPHLRSPTSLVGPN